MSGIQISGKKIKDQNVQKSPRRISDLAFFGGLIISCFSEIALIGYAINLPHLYYSGILADGLDFSTSLMLLVIGNVILFVEYKLKKSQ